MPGESRVRFEACVTSADGVLAAAAAGVDRVEMCADLGVGGVTPSIGLVSWAVAAPPELGVHVLIRPRAGDFRYSAAEADVMFRDIAAVKAAGADGVVIGALTVSGGIDVTLCSRLVAAARPMSVTFHRAFDAAADPLTAFEDVLELGVDRLLTSGAAASALDGADLIASLVKRAAGILAIMPGGGVTAANAAEILRRTAARDLHFSAQRSGNPNDPLTTRLAAIISAAAS